MFSIFSETLKELEYNQAAISHKAKVNNKTLCFEVVNKITSYWSVFYRKYFFSFSTSKFHI